jgi:hypothetical protein
MVLRPLEAQTLRDTCVPAWEAVAQTQKQPSASWWLIAQPDHADLAADLADRMHWQHFPAVDAEVLDAIRLHDEGWAEFDRTPAIRGKRPLSFLDIQPSDFLKAWRASIARAEQSSAIGGLLVSSHFKRLAQFRLRSSGDDLPDTLLVSEFLRQEHERELRLSAQLTRGQEEINTLVDALQFCDLLSLYLCCGSREEIEFPQTFQGHSIRARYEKELCLTTPALFTNGISLGITARRFPDCTESATLPILLA